MATDPLYSDLGGEYLLLDFHLTHSQLLMRKLKNRTNDRNTDIIFKPIMELYIPARFKGISISHVTDAGQIKALKQQYKFSADYGYKIFKICDVAANEFYLTAMAFGVFENYFQLMETHLEGDLQTEDNKLIFWYRG
jgi:hypothetical protein